MLLHSISPWGIQPALLFWNATYDPVVVAVRAFVNNVNLVAMLGVIMVAVVLVIVIATILAVPSASTLLSSCV